MIKEYTVPDFSGASLAFDPVPPPHVPKTYTGGKKDASIAGTTQIDVYTRNPRLGYRVTGSLARGGVWIPFKSKIVQMDNVDMIRQEYVNHSLAIPKRNEFVTIPTSVSPFIGGFWSESEYKLMRAGQMQTKAKKVHALYVVQRDKYTAALPLLDNNGKAMPVLTAGIRLTGGWRNPERNEFYSTAKGSKHQLANALDMAPPIPIRDSLNKRKPATFYWLLWKGVGNGAAGYAQLEDGNSKKLIDFKDKDKNGIPDAYDLAKHLHIQ